VTAPVAAAPVVKTTADKAIEKLGRLRDEVQQAFADADAVAADGTQGALALATGLLDRTLGPLRGAIDGVLATLGLRLPGAAAKWSRTRRRRPSSHRCAKCSTACRRCCRDCSAGTDARASTRQPVAILRVRHHKHRLRAW
jgi:hypothetical protein